MPKQEGFPQDESAPTSMTPEQIAQSREKLSKLQGSGIEVKTEDLQKKAEKAEKEAALKDLVDWLTRANLTTEDFKDLLKQAVEMVGDNYYVQQGEKSISDETKEKAKQFKGLKKKIRAQRAVMEAEQEEEKK